LERSDVVILKKLQTQLNFIYNQLEELWTEQNGSGECPDYDEDELGTAVFALEDCVLRIKNSITQKSI